MRDLKIPLSDYRKAYNRGWRHSSTDKHSLDNNPYPWMPNVAIGSGVNAMNDAWEDGYLDYAAGREKWHLLRCLDHSNCP